jgi:hypothetical protein
MRPPGIGLLADRTRTMKTSDIKIWVLTQPTSVATECMNKFKADPERHMLQYEGNPDG